MIEWTVLECAVMPTEGPVGDMIANGLMGFGYNAEALVGV